ncbi:primosomal replication protein N [Sodalis-like endosymbiont of Proechinophthirus fluctus]|uniref:primosomal replication protein N n=1 Tax=Sodalis-like endosymbiont of Proechinophthirus fluctus TaxID=1462730 RepID=UPI0007A8360F|nr:primosomal replication protein N [Sodalis-like endosymbiont of Proechinophthirus fluctus]KYP97723.1 primosomal replication protein N [Sodalis-like endosymbiont of Proechinophthirus fluctus]
MTANCLMLSGTVYNTPIRKVSPSGIPHCQFVLEHRSVQQEAGFSRKTWCRLLVVVSGKHTLDMTRSITVGAQITAQGFISCHQGRNSLNRIVLHAEQINLIDSGD